MDRREPQPVTGDWIARDHPGRTQGVASDRGKDYNHSTYCDLVITGLVGLRPRADDIVEVNPLVPEGPGTTSAWTTSATMAAMLTILYDKTGERYGKGKGLRVFADGHEIAVAEGTPSGSPLRCPALAQHRRPAATRRGRMDQVPRIPCWAAARHLLRRLPAPRGRHVTACGSPGGPRRAWPWSKARTASTGAKPEIVLGPDPETDWEADINRPVVSVAATVSPLVHWPGPRPVLDRLHD